MATIIHYWKFNNNLNDSIGSYNLTAGSGNSYGTGKLNQDIQWDNSGSYAAGATGPLTETTGWTICGWFKHRLGVSATTGFKLIDGNNDVDGTVSLRLYYSSGSLMLGDPDYSTFGPVTVGAISADTWYFVYVRCSTTDSRPRYYYAINMGAEGFSSPDSGSDSWTGINVYDSVDDLRVYDYKLLTTDLSAIYNNGNPSELNGGGGGATTVTITTKTNNLLRASKSKTESTTNRLIGSTIKQQSVTSHLFGSVQKSQSLTGRLSFVSTVTKTYKSTSDLYGQKSKFSKSTSNITYGANSIIHYYKFNGNLVDSINGGVNLVSTGASYGSGILNEGLKDSSATGGNYNIGSYPIPPGDFTITGWFNLGSPIYAFRLTELIDQNNTQLELRATSTYCYFYWSGDLFHSYVSSVSMVSGQWYFFDIKYQSGSMSFSINRESDVVAGLWSNQWPSGIPVYNFGSNTTNYSLLDDVRIFNYALSNTELNSLYNYGYPSEYGTPSVKRPHYTRNFLKNSYEKYYSTRSRFNKSVLYKSTSFLKLLGAPILKVNSRFLGTINKAQSITTLIQPKPLTYSSLARLKVNFSKNHITSSNLFILWRYSKQYSTSNTSSSFGNSVSLSSGGLYAVVGEPNTTNGQAVVYSRADSNSAWSVLQTLTASDAASGDKFGYAVTISRDASTIVIGAPGKNSNVGRAYVFTKSGSTFSQSQILTAPVNSASFGNAVTISGNASYVAIGAPTSTFPGNPSNTGAVYPYALSGGSYSALTAITITNANAKLGSSLAISDSGSRLVIGAPGRQENGLNPNEGGVYVYTLSGGSYSQTQELQPDILSKNHYFGASVTCNLDASTIVGGGYGNTGDYPGGAVHIFTLSGTWTETLVINGSTSSSDNFNFGISVAISTDATQLVAGASTKGIGGKVLAYSKVNSAWSKVTEISGYDTTSGDAFGSSIGFSKDGISYGKQPIVMAVGAPNKSPGTIYFYNLTTFSLFYTLSANINSSKIKIHYNTADFRGGVSKTQTATALKRLTGFKLEPVISTLKRGKSILNLVRALLKYSTSKTENTNVFLRLNTQKTQTAQASKKANPSKTLISLSLLRQGISKSYNNNALLKLNAQKTILTRSLLRSSSQKTQTVRNLLRLSGSKNQSINGLLKSSNPKSHLSSALVRKTTAKQQLITSHFFGFALRSQITYGYIISFSTSSKSQKITADLAGKVSRSQGITSLNRLSGSKTQAANAIFKASPLKIINNRSLLRLASTRTQLAFASLKSSLAKTQGIISLLRLGASKNQLIRNLLRLNTTKAQQLSSLLRYKGTKTLILLSLLKNSLSRSLVTYAVLKSAPQKIQSLTALIKASKTKPQTIFSLIKASPTRSQNIIARLKQSAIKTQTINEILKASSSKTEITTAKLISSIQKTVKSSSLVWRSIPRIHTLVGDLAGKVAKTTTATANLVRFKSLTHVFKFDGNLKDSISGITLGQSVTYGTGIVPVASNSLTLGQALVNSSAAYPSLPSGDFTFTGWFKLTKGTSNNYTVLSFNDTALTYNFFLGISVGYQIWGSTSVVNVGYPDPAGTYRSNVVAADSQWYFFSIRQTDGNLTFSINRESDIAAPYYSNQFSNGLYQLNMGTGTSADLSGYVDDIRIFNYSVPDSDLNVIYNNGQPLAYGDPGVKKSFTTSIRKFLAPTRIYYTTSRFNKALNHTLNSLRIRQNSINFSPRSLLRVTSTRNHKVTNRLNRSLSILTTTLLKRAKPNPFTVNSLLIRASSKNQYITSLIEPRPVTQTIASRLLGFGTRAQYISSSLFILWRYFRQYSTSNSSSSFGSAISISAGGLYAVVGEPNTANGQAVVYSRSDSNSFWSVLQTLTASDGTSGDKFGYSVNISRDGNTIIIGAKGKSSGAGGAYVFKKSGSTFSQSQILTAPTNSSSFGNAVTISGNGSYIAIGAPTSTFPGNPSNTGAVYPYVLSAGSYTALTGLVITNANANFGTSLTITDDGARLIIGAPGRRESAKNSNQGSIYVYSLSGGNYAQTQELQPTTLDDDHYFGTSVSCNSDASIIVGGGYGSTTSYPGGAVHIFSLSGTWSETTIINGSSSTSDNFNFGISVAISADATQLVAGASTKGTGGKVLAYSRVNSSWSKTTEFSGYDTSSGDAFGYSIGFSKDSRQPVTMGVGAPNKSLGAVYFYNLTTFSFYHTLSAYINTTKTKTHSITADFKGAVAKSSFTTAYKRLLNYKLQPTISYFKSGRTRLQNITALLKASSTRGETTNVLLRASILKPHLAQSLLKSSVQKTQGIYGYIRSSGTKSQYSIGLLRGTLQKTQYATGLLKKSLQRNQSVTALIRISTVRSHGITSLLKFSSQKPLLTRALLKSIISKATISNTLLKASKTKQQYINASVRLSIAKIQLSYGLLRFTGTKSHIINSILKVSVQKTQRAFGFIKSSPTRLYLNNSLLKQSILKSQNIRSLLKLSGTKSQLAYALLRYSNAKVQNILSLLKLSNLKIAKTTALLKSSRTGLHYAISLLKSSITRQIITNTRLKAGTPRAFNTSSLLRLDIRRSYYAYSLLRISVSKAQNVFALTRAGTTRLQFITALLRLGKSKDQIVKTLLRKSTSSRHFITSHFFGFALRVAGTNAQITAFAISKLYYAVSDLAGKASRSQFTRSLLRFSITKNQLSDALLKLTGSKSHLPYSLLRTSVTRTQSSRSLLRFSVLKEHLLRALLRGSITKTQTPYALLRLQSQKTQLTKSLLSASSTRASLVRALLRATNARNFIAQSLLKISSSVKLYTLSLLKSSTNRLQKVNFLTKGSYSITQKVTVYKVLSSIVAQTTKALLKYTANLKNNIRSLLKSSVSPKHIAIGILRNQSLRLFYLNSFLRKTVSLINHISAFLKSSVHISQYTRLLLIRANSAASLVNNLLYSLNMREMNVSALLKLSVALNNNVVSRFIGKSFITQGVDSFVNTFAFFRRLDIVVSDLAGEVAKNQSTVSRVSLIEPPSHSTNTIKSLGGVKTTTHGSYLARLLTADSNNRFKSFINPNQALFFYSTPRDLRDIYYKNRRFLISEGYGNKDISFTQEEPKLMSFDLPIHNDYPDFVKQDAVFEAKAPTARTRISKQVLPTTRKNKTW